MRTDKRSRVVKGGLEFIPLRPGHAESEYQVPRGCSCPGQLSLILPEVVDAGGRRRRAQRK